jgi:hypothetical protein
MEGIDFSLSGTHSGGCHLINKGLTATGIRPSNPGDSFSSGFILLILLATPD